jgi:hypothetical protein
VYTAITRRIAEFDTPGKRREIFEHWFPEYETSHATDPGSEPRENHAALGPALQCALD